MRSETSELLINIENAGAFVIPLSAVRDVHSGKLILEVEALEPDLREALRHTHDAEDPQYAASCVDDVLADLELPSHGPLTG